MCRSRNGRLAFVAALCVMGMGLAFGGDAVVSTMRQVKAVANANGFYLTPAYGAGGVTYPGDLAPSQAFEIIRPAGQPVTIGRLYTSCVCVSLSANKRSFGPGERAVLEMRNVKATPPNGQTYAVYVQITRPIRATLQYNTFVQSDQFKISEPIVVSIDPEPEVAVIEEPAPVVEIPAEPVPAESAVDAAVPEAVAEQVAEEAHQEAADEAVRQAVEEATEKGEEELEKQTVVLEAAPVAAAVTPAPAAATVTVGEEPAEPESAPAVSLPPQVVTMITLGVSDLQRSREFYEALGWKPVRRENSDRTVFFQMNGQLLCLYPLSDLLREQNMEEVAPTPGGVTLAVHLKDKEDVARSYFKFMDAGAKSLKSPTEMPSGALTAYVADPDGNVWEISWVPHYTLDANGGLVIPQQ